MTNKTTLSITANLQLLYVSDIERSSAFYQRVFKKQPVFTSPRYVAFSATGEGLSLSGLVEISLIPKHRVTLKLAYATF